MSNTNSLQKTQVHWDWRAAGNFICGGAGAALILFTTAHAMDTPQAIALVVVGLALVGLGLFCVWLEIGRPWRAMNVFVHVRTSWMSRESVAAAFLFLLGAGLVFGMTWRAWPMAVVAFIFIFCQARIVMAARGIPAWRIPATGVLLVLTAIAEGIALFCAISAWIALPVVAIVALALVTGARAVAFEAWANAVDENCGPIAGRWVSRMTPSARIAGGAVPLALLALAVVTDGTAVFATLAGVLVVATGAAFKFILITRMGQQHGFSLPRMPVRGVPRTASR